jgi:hypothetical protein
LKIGDLVFFKDVVRNINLGVEGILMESLVGIDESFSLQDSIFCIHLQRQYSASRDLNAFFDHFKKLRNDTRNIEDESAKRYLKALQVNCFVNCYLNLDAFLILI